MKKECPICMEMIDEHAQECPFCHEQTGFAPAPKPTVQPKPQSQQRKKPIWIWVLIALLTAVIGLLSYFLFTQNQQEMADSEESDTELVEVAEAEYEEIPDAEKFETGEEDMPIAEPGRGDLGGFDLRGPVKKVVYSESSYTFNEQGQLLTENGESLKSIFPGGVKRDKNGRLIECNADGYGSRYYTYNANGLPTEIRSDDSGRVLTYDENGYVKTEEKTIEPDMGSEDAPEVINLTYTILEKDSYGNWTKRKDQNGDVESRQISYFEDSTPENVVKGTTASEKPSKPVAKTEASPSQSEPKVQKKVAQPVKKVQKPERNPVQNNRKKIEEAEPAPQNKGTGFHFERVDRVP